jgi:hypothetical protein
MKPRWGGGMLYAFWLQPRADNFYIDKIGKIHKIAVIIMNETMNTINYCSCLRRGS